MSSFAKLVLVVVIVSALPMVFARSARAIGPAGVSDGLKLWLSADSGVKDSGGNDASDTDAAETWEDQSNDARTAIRQSGSGATFSVTGLNFNPTLNFNGNRYSFDDTGLPAGSSDRSIFVVASTNDVSSWRYVLGTGTFGSGQAFDFGNRAGDGTVFITTHSSQTAETSSWLPLGTARLAYGAVTGGPLFISVNGGSLVAGSGGSVNTVLSGAANIGSNARGDEYWNGSISEVIMFDRTVTATERQRINSYLALKYGFSLDQSTPQSYLASGSNLMWDKDADGASTYNNGLFGIGRDDASNLAQIKSRGQTATNVIILEAVDEGANGNPDFKDMDDLEFLVIGDNNGAATWTTTGAPDGYSVLSRRWMKQEQGDVGPVHLDFDVATSAFNIPDPLDEDKYYFIYDTNNNGSLADETPQAMTDQGGNLWRATVDFGEGGIFTLASTQNPAVVNLSPSNNATDVSVNTDLIITFSQAVTADTGNITIHRSSDDVVVETISVSGGQVAGSGTDTITIDLSTTLAGDTEYYVLIPSTALRNGDNYFGGISSTLAWRFTTEEVAEPSPSPTPTATPTSSQNQTTGRSRDSLHSSSVPNCKDKVPVGVSDLFQINRTRTSAKLYFTPVNDHVTAYHVVYGFSKGEHRFGQIDAVVSQEENNGVQSITVNYLDPNEQYWFTVIPVNGCASGDWSNWLGSKRITSGNFVMYRWLKNAVGFYEAE